MSSILDALNKLEEERAAQQQAEADYEPVPVAPEEAAEALLGRPKLRSSSPSGNVPWAPILTALFAGVAITALVVGMVFRFTGGQEEHLAAAPPPEDPPTAMHTYTVPTQAAPESPDVSVETPVPTPEVSAAPPAQQPPAKQADAARYITAAAPSRQVVSPIIVPDTLPELPASSGERTPVARPVPAPPPPAPEPEPAPTPPPPTPAPEPESVPVPPPPLPAPEPEPEPTPPPPTPALEPEPEPVPPPPPPAPEPEPEPTPPSPPPAPEPEPEPVPPPLPPAPEPEPEPVPPPAPAPAPEPAPVPEPAPLPSPPAQETAPVPASHIPAAPTQQTDRNIQVAERTDIIPSQTPSFSTPVTMSPPQPRQESLPVDIERLQRLSAQDRSRLRLDNLRLNVLREASRDHPEPMAIINLKKVYVGETIPGTRVRLIGVTANGIGIEVEDTRERYRIPR